MRLSGEGWRTARSVLLWGSVGMLLWWSWRPVSLHELWVTVSRVSPSLLVMLVAINLVILWCFGGRGWLILRALGYRVPYHRQVAYRTAAFSVNYFTPGPQFGGEPLHVYLLHRCHAVPWDAAVATVAVDKLLEMTVNLSFLLLGLGVLVALDVLPVTARVPLFAGSVLLISLPLLHFGALVRGCFPLERMAAWLGRHVSWALLIKVLRHLARAEAQAGGLYRAHVGAMALALGLSVATWGLLIGEYALMTCALGVRLSFFEIVAVMTAARLAFLFPSPAGLGALEASQSMAMRALGLDPTLGLAVTLLIRVRDVLVGVAGLVVARRYAWIALRGRNDGDSS